MWCSRVSQISCSRNAPGPFPPSSSEFRLTTFFRVRGLSFAAYGDVFALSVAPGEAESVLAHRIILRPNAEMQGQSAGKLVAGLLEREHVPQMAYDG